MGTALKEARILVERDYPDLEINVARDSGDVVVLWLQDTKDYRDANCIIASYNMWYPGEIMYYKPTIIEEK